MSDIIGSVTGVATFHEIEITNSENKDRYEVTGHYHDSVTIYGAPEERLQIEHMEVGIDSGVTVTLTPVDDSFIWVEATEDDYLIITREDPTSDNDNSN
jgi:hypothetical protein